MIEIKKLPAERWKEFKKLRLEALKTEPTAFSSAYEEQINQPEEFWQSRMEHALIALNDDKPIGMVAYVFENQIKTRHIASIISMYVSRDYRNRKTGTKLIEKAISLIQENPEIHKIKLSVNPEQQFAVKLYEKFGFKNVGLFKNEMRVEGQYYDEMPMEKLL